MDRHDEFALADRFNWAEWKRIFKYVKPYNKHVLALLFAALCGLSALAAEAETVISSRYVLICITLRYGIPT